MNDPQCVDVEMQLLGGIMADRDSALCLELARSIIQPSDFYLNDHGLAFRVMCEIADRGQQPDVVAVMDEIESRGQLHHVGGKGVIMGWYTGAVSGAGTEMYSIRILHKATLREIVQLCHEVIKHCYLGQDTADEILHHLQTGLDRIGSRMVAANEIVTLEQFAAAAREFVMERATANTQRVTTGWENLDALIDGYTPQSLGVWAARPNCGKSRLLLYSLIRSALDGHKCGFISLDMGERELFPYVLTTVNNLTGNPTTARALFEPVTWDGNTPMIREACFAPEVGGRFLLVPNPQSASIGAVEGHVRKLAELGCKVVAIDQCQNVNEFEPGDRAKIQEVLKAFKRMARRYNICLILVHQINRDGSNRPTLENLKETGNFEEFASWIILLHDPARALIKLHGCYVETDGGRYIKPTAKHTPAEKIYDAPDERVIWLDLAKSRNSAVRLLETRFNFQLGIRPETRN